MRYFITLFAKKNSKTYHARGKRQKTIQGIDLKGTPSIRKVVDKITLVFL